MSVQDSLNLVNEQVNYVIHIQIFQEIGTHVWKGFIEVFRCYSSTNEESLKETSQVVFGLYVLQSGCYQLLNCSGSSTSGIILQQNYKQLFKITAVYITKLEKVELIDGDIHQESSLDRQLKTKTRNLATGYFFVLNENTISQKFVYWQLH